MPETEPLLSSQEAGQILNKSARTVQRMVQAGELAYAQKLTGPNGAYLFRRADIEALAEADERVAS